MVGPQIFHVNGSGQIQLHKCSIVAPEIHDNIFLLLIINSKMTLPGSN